MFTRTFLFEVLPNGEKQSDYVFLTNPVFSPNDSNIYVGLFFNQETSNPITSPENEPQLYQITRQFPQKKSKVSPIYMDLPKNLGSFENKKHVYLLREAVNGKIYFANNPIRFGSSSTISIGVITYPNATAEQIKGQMHNLEIKSENPFLDDVLQINYGSYFPRVRFKAVGSCRQLTLHNLCDSNFNNFE